MEFNEKLKTVREYRKLKPIEVAKRAKISKGYYSTLESGKQKKPGIQIATRLAQALDVSVDELLSPLPFRESITGPYNAPVNFGGDVDWEGLMENATETEKHILMAARGIIDEKKEKEDRGQDKNFEKDST